MSEFDAIYFFPICYAQVSDIVTNRLHIVWHEYMSIKFSC